MQERNLTRKSAIQFLRRQRSTNSNLLLTAAQEATAESNAHKATEELETLPPAQSVAPVVETVATPLAVEVSPVVDAAVRRARNTGFDAAKAVELYKAGTKVVDIAVALGYERGQGQNRTRAALKAAGVLVETVAAAPEAPTVPAA